MQDVPNPATPPVENPVQPSEPAQPTIPPAEAPQPPPDIDIPAPGNQPTGAMVG